VEAPDGQERVLLIALVRAEKDGHEAIRLRRT
jgi:hypothetical protein